MPYHTLLSEQSGLGGLSGLSGLNELSLNDCSVLTYGTSAQLISAEIVTADGKVTI